MNKYASLDVIDVRTFEDAEWSWLYLQITHKHCWEDNDYEVTLVRGCSMPDAVGTRTINHN